MEGRTYSAVRGWRGRVWGIAALMVVILSCLVAGSAGASNRLTIEGERMALATDTGKVFQSSSASNDEALLLDNGVASRRFTGSGPAAVDTTSGYEFGLIGNDGTHLQQERDAGIQTKVLRLSWREYYPAEGTKNTAYIQRKKDEIRNLRAAGFKIILAPGYHDTPTWLHQNYADSYYVNQYGERYTGDGFSGGFPVDSGDANLVFNKLLRGLVASYMKDIFSEFGTDFWAVRLGGGRYGELTYPPAGLYRVGELLLYTNRGIGMLPPRVRFLCRPEITAFTLYPQ